MVAMVVEVTRNGGFALGKSSLCAYSPQVEPNAAHTHAANNQEATVKHNSPNKWQRITNRQKITGNTAASSRSERCWLVYSPSATAFSWPKYSRQSD